MSDIISYTLCINEYVPILNILGLRSTLILWFRLNIAAKLAEIDISKIKT